jgi:hypothetical protein
MGRAKSSPEKETSLLKERAKSSRDLQLFKQEKTFSSHVVALFI